jgi:acyl carrier protein
MDAIESEIERALGDELGRRPRATDSLTSLGLDSLRMAELATRLESEFGIRVDEELLDVDTVGELVDYVRSRATR